MTQRPALLLASLLALALVHVPAAAQTAPKASAKPAAKPAAKAPVEAPLPPANADQLEAANIAHLGDYACEFDQTVTLQPYAKAAGYIEMKQKAQAWVMKPVLSSTGALRLEDVKGRMLMIQIANKSMVMDTKIGQRLVDGCVHEKQRAFMATQANLLSPAAQKQ
ncbi:MAG TPA: hypothetical protein VFQ16_17675 [Burkholderiaceae bacterium]|nr:hypothetical protein [Burkholderiaceae bacterium]